MANATILGHGDALGELVHKSVRVDPAAAMRHLNMTAFFARHLQFEAAVLKPLALR
jgi:hypothetical protein